MMPGAGIYHAHRLEKIRPPPDPGGNPQDQEKSIWGHTGGLTQMRNVAKIQLVNIFNAEIIVMRLLLIATLLVVLVAMAM